jgi:hypothetical protein
LAYLRQEQSEKVLVALNFGNHPDTLTLPDDAANKDWHILFSSSGNLRELATNRDLILDPHEILLLVKDQP